MTSLTYNVSTGTSNESGMTGSDKSAVEGKSTVRVTDHTHSESFNISENTVNTELYFKHATSDRQISAAEAKDTNAIVMISGMATDYKSAVAAGLISEADGTRVEAQAARTEPAPQHEGEDMVDVGEDEDPMLGETELAALGMAAATAGADNLVDMVLRADESGAMGIDDLASFSESMGAESSAMANHLLHSGNEAFEKAFGDQAVMYRDFLVQNKADPAVREAIKMFVGGHGMQGFKEILDNI